MSKKIISTWLVRIGSIALVTAVTGYLSQISGAAQKTLSTTTPIESGKSSSSSGTGKASSGSPATGGNVSLGESDSLAQSHAGGVAGSGDSSSYVNPSGPIGDGGYSGEEGYSGENGENHDGFTLIPNSPGQQPYVHPHTRSRAS